jgi:hypothetical protein
MILTTISAGEMRLALRIYFLLALGLLTVLTQKILQFRARLQVARQGSLAVHRVIGWLQGFYLVKAFWQLRRAPGVKLGYLIMANLFVLSKMPDLITTALVRPIKIQSRCSFTKELVFNQTTDLFANVYPPSIACLNHRKQRTVHKYKQYLFLRYL